MARFDRKVERQKSEFAFSKKEVIVKTKKDIFKENFRFKWMKLDLSKLFLLVFDFIMSSLFVIPIMMIFISNELLSFILGHTIFTSLFIVASFAIINKEKPSMFVLLTRYLFLFIVLGLTSFVATLFA